MTQPTRSAPAPAGPTRESQVPVPRSGQATTCCHREMSTIEVTTRGATLTLHSCTACGRHLWERDGQLADRAELLDGVKTFLQEPRIATPRRRRSTS